MIMTMRKYTQLCKLSESFLKLACHRNQKTRRKVKYLKYHQYHLSSNIFDVNLRLTVFYGDSELTQSAIEFKKKDSYTYLKSV